MAVGGLGAALLVALTLIALNRSSGDMGYLYTDLDPSAAQSIVEKLKAQNVDFRLSADGTAVMAPQDRIAELRMALAGEQLGGKIGYEVLDAEQPFGLSAAREKLNETRAIEGELAKSINTLQNVTAARVHIVMPDKAIFAREERKATAAVTVKTRGRLPTENIEAIRSLVAASVPDLTPQSVSVIDNAGRLLARAGEEGGSGAGEMDEREQALEGRLRDEIEALIAPIVGEGKVRAEVSADIDREQRREESHAFDPDKQVIARQITVESGNQSQENQAAAQGVSVSAQLPTATAAPAAPPPPGDASQTRSNETSEDTSYDNSRTDTVTTRNPGAIKRLTVAVMVDPGEKKSLPDAQVQKIQRLVENAVGFDAARGDSVIVEAMPFSPPQDEGSGLDFLSRLPTGQIFPLLELLVVAGAGLMVLKLVRGKPAPVPEGGGALLAGPEAATGEGALALAPMNGGLALPEPQAGDLGLSAPGDPGHNSHMAQLDQEIALAQVEGGIKASSLKRIGETITANPAESASVIRQWMNA